MKKVWIMMCCIISIIPTILLGCGSGGSEDSITSKDSGYETLVESNYRDVILEWQPNSESNLAGYRVFMRADGNSYDYNNPEWETVDTDCKLYNLDKHITYHFVVRAFSTEGDESGDSNEVILNSV